MKSSAKHFAALAVLFFASIAAHAQQFYDHPDYACASVGIHIENETGEVAFSHNSNKSLVPASTLKLFSTATAVEMLGSDYRFKTRVFLVGKAGNEAERLIIVGSGDPTLGSEIMGMPEPDELPAEWAQAIQQTGVRRIRFGISILESPQGLKPVPDNWVWNDLGNYFGAGNGSLNYADNTCKVFFKSGEPGSTPSIIKTIPKDCGITWDNHLESAVISYDSAYFYGAPNQGERMILGKIPANRKAFVVKASLPKPSVCLAEALQLELRALGVELPDKIEARAAIPDELGSPVIEHTSPTLNEIVKQTNLRSINLYAESLAGAVAANERNANSGIKSIKDYWSSLGMPLDGFFIDDASGLSRYNAATPKQFVFLLRHMDKRTTAANRSAFTASLPVSGHSGSIRKMWDSPKEEGKVQAKSGYLSRVRSYAGYFTSQAGQRFYFSIMVNNYSVPDRKCKADIEAFLSKLILKGNE